MPPLRVRSRLSASPRRQAQRGVIMVLVLVALVLLLVAVAGMLRATSTSTSVIGNLAFRRDLTNRAELAIAAAKAALNSGAGGITNQAASNYSSIRLASPTGAGAIGIPAVLISDSAYATAGYSCMDGSGNILASASCTAGSDGILIRWVIDRQCAATGKFNTSACGYINSSKDQGGTAWLHKPNGAASALYRISVRVSGPRNTEAYIQATAG